MWGILLVVGIVCGALSLLCLASVAISWIVLPLLILLEIALGITYMNQKG